MPKDLAVGLAEARVEISGLLAQLQPTPGEAWIAEQVGRVLAQFENPAAPPTVQQP
jgi:hypothetical protein